MKKTMAFLLAFGIILTVFSFTGCGAPEVSDEENQPKRTVIELDESNYWKYLNVSCDMNNTNTGGEGSISYAIEGVLDYALYEDVTFRFDVIYYTDGQTEDEYGYYTMYIGCNAAGDAAFTTEFLGITHVTVGKLYRTEGGLVNFADYNWKIAITSVTGKVIYTQ